MRLPTRQEILKGTHSDKLDRWLGKGQTEVYSQMFRDWKGPPVALAGVPGAVFVAPGGDFCGPIEGGGFASLIDFAEQRQRRVLRNSIREIERKAGAGFSSLSDLISEATTGGKSQLLMYQKAATTATTVANAFSCFNVGTLPSAGGTGGTSGTGRKCVRTTTGALRQDNAAGGDQLHLTTWTGQATAVSSLMLYDRLWDMTHNHASALTTNVDASNRPDRYQTTGLAPGNFISGEVTTAGTTAHNITLTYVDDAGNTAEAAAAYAFPATAVAGRSPTVAGQWFVPLNAGDRGARYLTVVAQSTITSVTGITSWWIGHPISMMPFPVANVPFVMDGINSAFNLQRIYDDACLAFYTPMIATTGNITYTGTIQAVSG
jgi:hypothetical protein